MEDIRGTFAADGAPSAAAAGLNTKDASEFLKAMAHEGRLAILCHLLDGERSVGDLERRLGARQAAVSQQLARLRHEGLVRSRRDGKTIYYAVADPKVGLMLEALRALFCELSED